MKWDCHFKENNHLFFVIKFELTSENYNFENLHNFLYIWKLQYLKIFYNEIGVEIMEY